MAVKNVPDLLVCQLAAEREHNILHTPNLLELLLERTEEPLKVCFRALERSHDKGYIEYGVSLRQAWLTDKGRALLAEAQCAQAN